MVSLKRGLQVYSEYYLRGRTPVIVYAMGRVGSIAIFRSLQEGGVFALHAHVLDPENLKRKKGKRPGTSTWAYKNLICAGRPASIVSLVRNPLECMVSSYASRVRARFDPNHGYENVSSEDLSEQFRRGYFENNRHRQILDWFDYEFKGALGVNVYDQPFSRAAGFGCFKHAQLNVLLLRTDLSDERHGGPAGPARGRRSAGRCAGRRRPGSPGGAPRPPPRGRPLDDLLNDVVLAALFDGLEFQLASD